MNHEQYLQLQEKLKEVPIESWVRDSYRRNQFRTITAQYPSSFVRLEAIGELTRYQLPVGEEGVISVSAFEGERFMSLHPTKKEAEIYIGYIYHLAKRVECKAYFEGPEFSIKKRGEVIFYRAFAPHVFDDLESRYKTLKVESEINSLVIELRKKQNLPLDEKYEVKLDGLMKAMFS